MMVWIPGVANERPQLPGRASPNLTLELRRLWHEVHVGKAFLLARQEGKAACKS